MNLESGLKMPSTFKENNLSRASYIELLGLPSCSTLRLCKLKLAQIELDTKQRKDNEQRNSTFEELLKHETDRYISLKQLIDKDLKDKLDKEKAISKHKRHTDFYEEKVNKMNIGMLDKMDMDLKFTLQEVLSKRDELKRLYKSLEEFQDLEPNNEALKRKIDDLKKSRLSLEMTFVDEGGDNSLILL